MRSKLVKDLFQFSVLLCFLIWSTPNKSFAKSIDRFFINHHSDTFTLRGKVETDRGLPLEDATIVHPNGTFHTHSNQAGQFVLPNIKVGDRIYVYKVGYLSQSYPVEQRSGIVQLTPANNQLSEIIVVPQLQSMKQISRLDLSINPVLSSQELLRQVPGLFIGQHAGGGKAEQIFLRGFDIDHGTDISIQVDRMPVNMVSHAHGQGYADLHFVIPETIEHIDFDKGSYHASKGNFATAGYVSFKTKDAIDQSSVTLEGGSFGTFRTVGVFNVQNTEVKKTYFAGEFLQTDGPFESSQHFNRINLFGKHTQRLGDNKQLQIIGSHFYSKWDASGQIPDRAVEAGLISRFGAIDDTEGGETRRTNLSAALINIDPNGGIWKHQWWFSKYDFDLFSNFTFFLNDPINGDQIRQQEQRTMTGLNSDYQKEWGAKNGKSWFKFTGGSMFRNDWVKNNELSHTLNRVQVLDSIAFGDVQETNVGSYGQLEWRINKWSIIPGLRADYFNFAYSNKLSFPYQTSGANQIIVQPKLNVLYQVNPTVQLFIKSGRGFHSNDARVATGNGVSVRSTLPGAYGVDVGTVWKPHPSLHIHGALWYLYLQQEFVYVGDGGVVEPSGKTERKGIELSTRWQPIKWLYAQADATYTKARALEVPKEESFIPLAPRFTFLGSVQVQPFKNFKSSLRVRHLGDRPANETNEIVASGYTLVDGNLQYNWNKFSIGLIGENLFNTSWKETQFATESRLANETQAVEEIHFTPGFPFSLRIQCTVKF
jgi:outer membrane cobalamin receptor